MNNKLEMKKISEDNDAAYFEFLPYKKLIETKDVFDSIYNSGDINLMHEFLQENPAHPLALFAISEFYRMKQDHNNANILLEKLLYYYEECFCYEF